MNIEDIKKGDQVQIANGDYHKVTRVTRITPRGSVFIDLSNTHGFQVPIELITDHRPAFNWDDAKSGMCFKTELGTERWFIGQDFKDKEYAICAYTENCADTTHNLKSDLTRHPEGDVK